MDNIIIIADDLTGAADTAVQFCPYFEETTLVSYQQWAPIPLPAWPALTRAMAIYTNSRALEAEQAHSRLVSLAQMLGELETLRIYKKIDSCMRGNVGAESDALLDQLGCTASFITPALPEMGRTTRDDIHRIQGIALNQTEIAHDPVTPVTESSLTRIVALQSRYPVGHVGLAFLEDSIQRLNAEIKRQMQRGIRHIVFDATDRSHLDRLAQSIFALGPRILPVGSAGLAGSIASRLSPKPASDAPARRVTPGGFNLMVCGTASAVTGEQIDHLLASHAYERLQLNPAILADRSRKAEFPDAVRTARAGLLKQHVILTIQPQPSSRNARRPPDFRPAADSIVKGLGQFVAEVVAGTRPGHLFLTGGDTADAVLTAFGAEGMRILGEVVAGVVQGVIIGGLLEGLPVVTKAGAFGQKDTLVAVHEFWQERQRTEVR